METGETLRNQTFPQSGHTLGAVRTGLLGRLQSWIPFVFPWSPLQRMTGVVVTESGISLARGRLDGRFFHVDGTVVLDGTDFIGDLRNLGIPAGEPVCVCLPRNKAMVRQFRVPSTSCAEIDAMLPHLLAAELPLSAENFSWVWQPLPSREDDFTTMAVSVARNDQLEQFLAPLLKAGLNVVGLVPEGWCWAHVTGRAVNDANPDHPVPEVQPDAKRISEEGVDTESNFAASVAVVGLGARRLMIPRELGRRSRRRTGVSFLAGLGRLAILAAMVWLAFAVVEDSRDRLYLEKMEQKIIADGAQVEALQMEYNAVRESNRGPSGNPEVLQVLTSLRGQVQSPIFLSHMNYVQGRGVTLRGKAPASSHVLEMTEMLEVDPLWKSLRVMQLRSEKNGDGTKVHFVVEGQLNQVKPPREEEEPR